jgi:hypothetical protein
LEEEIVPAELAIPVDIDYTQFTAPQTQSRRASAYEIGFDLQQRQEIGMIADPLLRQERLEEQNRYVKKQVETLLGEVFNVEQSSFRYDIVDGKLFGEDMPGPALDSFKRGRDHRRIHGNPEDWGREDAEVDGFKKVEQLMADPKMDYGKMVMYPSPPGGSYPKNFYDIAVKKIDDKGEYVEFTRFSSGLSYDEYRDFLRELGVETPDEPTDSFFLANPVVIDDPRFRTPDQLHAYLHRDHEFMTKDEFDEIIKGTAPYIRNYVDNPSKFNLKVAVARALELRDERKQGIISIVREDSMPLYEEIQRLGSKKLEDMDLACGNLDLENNMSAPDRVSAFDRNYDFDIMGQCVVCGKEGMLGPCKICEPCDAKARKENKKLG